MCFLFPSLFKLVVSLKSNHSRWEEFKLGGNYAQTYSREEEVSKSP